MRISSPLHRYTLLFLMTLAVAPASLAQNPELASQLPNMGDAGGEVLSPEQERQLGQKFMHSVRERFTLLDDPLANIYLQDLADRLLSQYSGHSQAVSVFIIDDPAINAFAGPGGHIGVYSGLILAARSEAELASVLAHEIAHIVQRHLVRRFTSGKQQNLQTIGAMIAAILLGGSNPQASEAILSTAVATNIDQQLSYSRAHEQEADRIGLELLASANFDPRAMVSFFSVLQKQNRISESRAPEFVRTHPLTTSRIADTEGRAQSYPPANAPENPLFQLIQARAAIFSKNGGAALAGYQQRLQQDSSPRRGAQQFAATSQQYALALAALTDERFGEARRLLASLLEAEPLRLQYHYTAAEIEIAAKQPASAEKILSAILEFYPGNLSLIELRATALLQMNRAQDAFMLLKQALRYNGVQARLYQLYAQTAIASGKSGEAYRSLAELEYSRGNIHQAIDYLEQALKDKTLTDFQRLSLESELTRIKTESSSAE